MRGDDGMESLFVNHIILRPENDFIQLVKDAGYPNSVPNLIYFYEPV